MNKHVKLCKCCYDVLYHRDPRLVELWANLASIQVHCMTFALKLKESWMLRRLELMGFIVTTEIPNYIVFKVHRKKIEDEDNHFCTGICNEK